MRTATREHATRTVSWLASPPPGIAGSPRPVAARPERRPDRESALATADVLIVALERVQRLARRRDVRIEGETDAARLPHALGPDLQRRIERCLAAAVARAHWGSGVSVALAIERGTVRLALGFAVATADQAASLGGIEWIDEIWSWELA
jgi:hypothetical protein